MLLLTPSLDLLFHDDLVAAAMPSSLASHHHGRGACALRNGGPVGVLLTIRRNRRMLSSRLN